MPRLKVSVSIDRSKNRAAIRSAPIRSPACQAARISSVLQFTSSAHGSRTLKWALAEPGGKFEGEIANLEQDFRSIIGTRPGDGMSAFGGKADIAPQCHFVRL